MYRNIASSRKSHGSYTSFLKKYDQIPSEEKCIALLLAEEKFFKVKQALEEEQNPPEIIHLDGDDDEDDYDKESIISTNTDIFETPPSDAITTSPPILPTEDAEDSLIMGNKELNTIPEKESDELIKSSVEDLILIPSESEDTSGSESMCILPSCNDFSPIDVPEEKAVLENIERKDSYDSNLDESDLLVTPLFDVNEDKCFDSGGDVDKINDFKDGYYDSERDILYLESLLNDDLVHHDPSIPAISVAFILEGFTDKPPLEENDDLFDLEPKNDEWKKILYEAQIDDLMSEDKNFDPGIPDQKISLIYVSLPFEDRHYLFFTYVV
nr:hypothetical protein [Tanacetum cinerariifolium]